jgi:hypothetical protein
MNDCQDPGSAVRYDVFLSHNSKDKPVVERIAVKLRQAGVEPWLDSWHLTPGGRWQEEIARAVRERAATCAIFVGPHGIGDWSREELELAKDRAAKDRAYRLFLVLLPGLPEPFDPTGLPPFLSSHTWVDLRMGFEDTRVFQRLINAVKGIPLGPPAQTDRARDICPYRGLQTFDEADAEFFFGRDADIQRLLEKLKATRFLAVVGASGTGKSSLVRAGLVPALKRGRLPGSESWLTAILTPGAHPLTALAAQLTRLAPASPMTSTLDALAGDARALHLAASLVLDTQPALAASSRLLLCIDQFEEIFTLCRDETERRAFVASLLYAATVPDGRVVVVLTMRADFYPHCAAYPDLAAQVAAHQYLVSPMDEAGLRAVIAEPAWKVGLEFEDGLIETILEDIAHQPARCRYSSMPCSSYGNGGEAIS